MEVVQATDTREAWFGAGSGLWPSKVSKLPSFPRLPLSIFLSRDRLHLYTYLFSFVGHERASFSFASDDIIRYHK